jgi:hypothetical protein
MAHEYCAICGRRFAMRSIAVAVAVKSGLIASMALLPLSADVTQFIVSENIFGTSNSGNAVTVESGSSDYYNITNNIANGLAISDGGTGTHKTISGNN